MKQVKILLMTAIGIFTVLGPTSIPETTSYHCVNIQNSTWTMYNSTSGSVSTIKFTTTSRWVDRGDGWSVKDTTTTFVRILNGHTYKGITDSGNGFVYSTLPNFKLCRGNGDFVHLPSQCYTVLNTTELNDNHMEFKDQHGGTIHLIRNGMPQIAKAETDCSRTDLTKNERYTCGYNHGYLDAQTDWNLHRFPPQSGGDNSCPHATEHTPEYCNGYAKGYTYEWNTLYQQPLVLAVH